MIWIILGLGLVLRLISLNQSLWLDEAINIVAAQKFSLWGMVTQYSIADFHPPGYFVILWVWGRLFGLSELSARLPSVIFGVLTILLLYLIGKKLVSKQLGLLSAVLLAMNPLHIYYSQEARMYSLAAFAVSLNMLFFINLIKGDKGSMGNVGNKMIYILSNLLVLLSDYVAYLIFPVQLVILLLKKEALKRWFIFLVTALLVSGWWLPIFLKQLSVGSTASANLPAWKEIVGTFGLKPLVLTYVKFIIGRISFSNPQIYAAIFLPIGLLFLFLIWRGYKVSQQFVRNLVEIWLFVPIILAALISFIIPVYSYFRLLFVLPSFLLLTSLGIYSFKGRFKIILLSMVIFAGTIFSLTYLLNPVFQREDWRGLVSFLKLLPKESRILFESSGSFPPFDYYAGNNLAGIGALKNFPANVDNDLIDLRATLKDVSDVYLINYLVEISDPNRLVQNQLVKLSYKQVDIKNFNGVGFVYHFVKNE